MDHKERELELVYRRALARPRAFVLIEFREPIYREVFRAVLESEFGRDLAAFGSKESSHKLESIPA